MTDDCLHEDLENGICCDCGKEFSIGNPDPMEDFD